jgi:hypothetical protein
MSVVRDDGGERQIRVDRMIEEFRTAQSRRLANANPVTGADQAVESRRDPDAQTALSTSTTTPTSHQNG